MLPGISHVEIGFSSHGILDSDHPLQVNPLYPLDM